VKPSRLLAAAFCATGLFLAFPPTAGANDITSTSVTCSGWSVSWTHFPETNVALTVAVDYPNGTTVTGQAFTYGEPEGSSSGSTAYEGAGVAHMAVSWDLDGEHHEQATDARLECVTPPTTVPVTVPPADPGLPPVARPTTPQTLPVGTTELAYTGTGTLIVAGFGVGLVALGAILYRKTR
jgi:hypothetical protein